MSTAPSTSIKCLMIGQAGIGKSTFLRKFPNSKLIETGDESCEKSSFNKPPATTTTMKQWKETYAIEYMNSHFEMVRLEMDNCDISLETCLQSTTVQPAVSANEITSSAIPTEPSVHSLSKISGQYIQMMPVQSSKFISIDAYKVIVLCFALDDSNSCELIKSKWEVELKRNRALQRHSFILLGFKSDLVFGSKSNIGGCQATNGASNENKNEAQEKENNSNANSKKAKKMKKRSSSVNSNSSTSRLKRRERMTSSEHYDASTSKLLINNAKKFAKQLGVQLIMVSSDAGSAHNSGVNANQNHSHELTIYEKFLKSITKKSELVERERRRDEEKAEKKNKRTVTTNPAASNSNSNSTNNSSHSSFKKIPKSISAPLSFLRAKTTASGRVKMTDLDQMSELDDLSLRNKNEHANESFIDHCKLPTTVEEIKPNEINSNLEKASTTEKSPTTATTTTTMSTSLSIRGKLSRFAIGLGTYLVTCGATTRTRKLADMKRLKNKMTYEETSSMATTKNNSSVITSGLSSSAARKFPIKRNKSWLLLSSELSINSTENDEVFSS